LTALAESAYAFAQARLLDSAAATTFEACRMAAAKRKDETEGRARRVHCAYASRVP